MPDLAKLKKVELRDIWKNEATDFTVWLAKPENLKLLGDEIGIEIELRQREAAVGSFSVDILAQESMSDRRIVIENQLEPTDHSHLGQIITYASGYDAEILIWIVADAREEHRRAVEWLNEHADNGIHFFLVKTEVWQIDDSRRAPKFNIVVEPNEWANVVKNSSNNAELSSNSLTMLKFWQRAKVYIGSKNSNMPLMNPRPQTWYNISFGSSQYNIALLFAPTRKTIGCELYIKNKDIFHFLQEQKSEIEADLGAKIEWQDRARNSAISIRKKIDDVDDEQNFEWLYQQLVKFREVFGKYLAEFKA
ncbi:MAG: DUF4268 domain-containing protein [Pseudomonadales bacterium]|jgi:hypothetical protein|nr:DUF4268 domain-containing protein [Pseudomonadales bacterium]